jgi:hypothetical protein
LFSANRAFFPYGQSASILVDAGLSPYRIDAALEKFGMPSKQKETNTSLIFIELILFETLMVHLILYCSGCVSYVRFIW